MAPHDNTLHWLLEQFQGLKNDPKAKYVNAVFRGQEDKDCRQVMRATREGLTGAANQMFAQVVYHALHGEAAEPMNVEIKRLFPGYKVYGKGEPASSLQFVAWILANTHNIAAGLPRLPRTAFEEIDNHVVTIRQQDTSGTRIPPLTFLPLSTALMHTGPPLFGTIPDREVPDHQSYVKVFISHRWYQPDQPNVPGDWTKLLLVFLHLIKDSVLACMALGRTGFPLKEWLDGLPLQSPQIVLDGDVTVGLCDNERVKIDRHLAQTVFLMAAAEVAPKQERYPLSKEFDSVFHRCCGSISRRILLWYDFASLPQNIPNKPRRTEDQTIRFRETLEQLAPIQSSMHTLLLDSNGENYSCRAWCLAEWMNSTNCSQWRKEGYEGNWPQCEIDAWMKRQCETFEAIIDPSRSSVQVLHLLNARFTKTSQTEKNTDIICWILWNAVVSRMLRPLWTRRWKDDGIVVGVGTRDDLIEWFRFISEGINRDEETPLTYNRTAWQRARERAYGNKISGKPKREMTETHVLRGGLVDWGLPPDLADTFNRMANRLEEESDTESIFYVSLQCVAGQS